MGRNMLKTGVTLRSMPVLYSLWYIYYITWLQRNGRFAPFLIPTLAADADEDLVCAVVNVPVVATSWFEGHIAVALHGFPSLSHIPLCLRSSSTFFNRLSALSERGKPV